uniref:Uncharacterized protein n=1 Tax=Fagus sylvatica TaxID=28930 RepID=A0A2N9G673_FAGSY
MEENRNGKGRFVTITALGDTKSKGYVIIPEGRDACGWNGVSQEISGIMAEQVHGKREVIQRRPETWHLTAQGNQVSNLVRESCIFKDAVTQGNLRNISIGIAGNQGELSQLCNGSNKDLLEISLKVLLGFGPQGEWEVKWAGVVQGEAKGLSRQQFHGYKQPEPKLDKRPRVNGSSRLQNSADAGTGQITANQDHNRVSVHSCDSESELSLIASLLLAPPTTGKDIAEAIEEVGEVDWSWGLS